MAGANAGTIAVPRVTTDPPAVATYAQLYKVGDEFRYRNASDAATNPGQIFSFQSTQEGIEDIVGALIQDSSTIDVTYDDSGNAITMAVIQSALDLSLMDNSTSDFQSGSQVTTAVNAHANLTNNPHSVTTTQIGAETSAQLDARDTANRARANHTGTQLAATVSDFEQEVINIIDQTYEQNNSEQVNTTTTFVDRHNFNKTPLHTDLYEIEATFTWAHDSTGTNIEVELLIDSVIVREMEVEPQDSGGSDGGAGTDQRWTATFKYIHSATASVDFNVQMRFRTESAGVESTIRDSVIRVKRALEV